MIKYRIKQLKNYLTGYGILGTIRKIVKLIYGNNPEISKYKKFIERTEPTEEELEKQKIEIFGMTPKISVIVPMYNTNEEFFKDLIECLKKQTYSNWELCLADGSTVQNIELQKYYMDDNRIKYKFLNKNCGIAGNSNEALKMTSGEYIVLLDHDDVLPIFALYEIVKCINENPLVEFIYTDEDKIRGTINNRCEPHFKPDFAPETLACHNYITHLVCIKKELMDKIKGFRQEYNGAQDFDLVLRATELTNRIIHIPKILYHWRVHKDSTAKNPDTKTYAFEAGKVAAQEHQIRMGKKAKVQYGGDTPGIYEVEYEVIGNPKVSILIPNKDNIAMLKQCINSILERTTYNNYEIIIIENNSKNTKTFNYYNKIKKNQKIKILEYPEKGFNYSKIINFGVKNCSGDFILQLNNDTKLLTNDWLEKFIGYAQQKEIGAVGAKLYFKNKAIQHAGIAIGVGGFAANIFSRLRNGLRGYCGKENLIQNLSAVTGACLFARKEIYEEVKYMDEENFKVALNDVDFCLKIRERGYRIVYNPYIELIHYESFSRGYEDTPEKKERFKKEIKYFKEKWKLFLETGDPYYNINLSRENAQYSIKNEWE